MRAPIINSIEPNHPMAHPEHPSSTTFTREGLVNGSDPSDDDLPICGKLRDEDGPSLLGVSISPEQTKYVTANTSAAEKAAALVDSPSDSFDQALALRAWESPKPSTSGHKHSLSCGHPPRREERPLFHQVHDDSSLPSPWHPDPKAVEPLQDGRSTLRDTFRRRAFSGSSTSSSDQHKPKKFLSFSFPYLPSRPKITTGKPFSFPKLPGSASFASKTESAAKPPSPDRAGESPVAVDPPRPRWLRSSSSSPRLKPQSADKAPPNTDHPAPTAQANTMNGEYSRSEDVLAPLPHIGGDAPTRPRVLRRVSSESSLTLRHSLSGASSLGDDTRFLDVRDQVNSRFKAIRDSLADANFRIPSIPSLPNLSLPNFNSFRAPSDHPGGVAVEAVRTRGLAAGITKSALYDGPDRPVFAPVQNTTPSPLENPSPKKSNSVGALADAMTHLAGDVVVLGGYRGSVLRSAKPPYRQLWIPVKVGLNLRKVDLEVGLEPEDEETMDERIIPSGMLTHIGPVDVSRRLLKRLRACENYTTGTLRVWNYGYDWRLSPHRLSQQLVAFLESLPSNQVGVPAGKRGALVIAHSLGGLITRHAVNQRPELFSGVLYAGVPQTCVNILGPLRNGDEVLLSSRVLTAQVNFTIRTSYVFLPEDGRCFLDKTTKEEYPVDFFNVDTWIEHALSPCTSTPLPPVETPRNGLGDLMISVPRLPLPGRKALAALNEPRRSPSPKGSFPWAPNLAEKVAEAAVGEAGDDTVKDSSTFAPQMQSQSHPTNKGISPQSTVSTAVTIPRGEAIAYLRRTLADSLNFKREMTFQPSHAARNVYPPVAVLYGKSVPTVYGAKVAGRDGIRRSDAYDDLAFASGDGVCLARAAMVPEGYEVVRGGRVSSDRGHVTLLGDLDGVGRCLGALLAGRQAGVGLGHACTEGATS
ncbi:MAG: hypothetical protein M1838_000849 [Thelocarpon superellum]|nr:MAG: hypothetical protein M1838_000849 [Thelocarpon superellum]